MRLTTTDANRIDPRRVLSFEFLRKSQKSKTTPDSYKIPRVEFQFRVRLYIRISVTTLAPLAPYIVTAGRSRDF